MPDLAPEPHQYSFIVDQEGYEAMNAVTTEIYGSDLADLAAIDPEFTYRLIRDAILESMGGEIASASCGFDTGVVLTTEEDGEAARLASITMMESTLASIIVRPIDVIISVFRSDTGNPQKVLEFTVEPPDLAF